MYTIPRNKIEGHPPSGGSRKNPATAKQRRILRRAGYSQADIEAMTSKTAYRVIWRHVKVA